MIKLIPFFCAAIFFLQPSDALAHQPQYVAEQTSIKVIEPEISKAYYAELTGTPAEYTFSAAEPFRFLVSLTVPDIATAETDYVIDVKKDGEKIFGADGGEFDWQLFHEEFVNDDYLQGPEFRDDVAAAGDYVVTVSSSDNLGKYVLVIGEQEVFTAGDVANVYVAVPQIKSKFFGKSGVSFALSPFGAPFGLLLVLLGVGIGRLYRVALKRLARVRTKPLTHHRNIGTGDRLLRLAIALVLLGLGVYFWSPVALICAGFTFYEAAASWCAFYSALGRNTCPL